MQNDPLIGPKSKIERAGIHLMDVSERVKAFYNPPPHYTSFRELIADGSREALKIKLIRDPSPDLATAVGDVIANLRSSLDQLACALAIKNGRGVSGVTFPFADSQQEFEAGISAKLAKLSPEAIDLIRAQKPHRGGNDVLWAMNRLRNTDIHRALIASVASIHGYHSAMQIDAGIGYHAIEQPKQWHPNDREITIVTFTPGAKLEYNLEVRIAIVFRDIDVIVGRPIVDVLQQFSNETEKIVSAFERRFFTT